MYGMYIYIYIYANCNDRCFMHDPFDITWDCTPADRAGLELCEEQRVPHASVWPTVWPITLTNCMVSGAAGWDVENYLFKLWCQSKRTSQYGTVIPARLTPLLRAASGMNVLWRRATESLRRPAYGKNSMERRNPSSRTSGRKTSMWPTELRSCWTCWGSRLCRSSPSRTRSAALNAGLVLEEPKEKIYPTWSSARRSSSLNYNVDFNELDTSAQRWNEGLRVLGSQSETHLSLPRGLQLVAWAAFELEKNNLAQLHRCRAPHRLHLWMLLDFPLEKASSRTRWGDTGCWKLQNSQELSGNMSWRSRRTAPTSAWSDRP